MIQLTETQRCERDRLFAELSDGRLDPGDAEAQAAALGLGRLTPALEPARFDPMRDTHWTLAMAVAWIAWADLGRVRDCLPRWRDQHQDWFWREYTVGDGTGGILVRAGWLLERTFKGEAPLFMLSLCEAIEASEGVPPDVAQRATIHDAKADLWAKLGAGQLKAITIVDGSPRQIPEHEWPFLEPIEHRGTDVLRAGRDMFAMATTYNANDILLWREDVLRLWSERAPTAAGEVRAEKSLRALCESAANGGLWPKASEWPAAAAKEFNISGRGALRVWAKVAEDFPALSSSAGKPKRRRADTTKVKRGAN
ncbi:hypothetical protein [Candidatus Viadribacter manganicus]|uniref:Uncharacterized protein n=1 Tax=Candidatus Viadribacter manganicus TaxID=1759059 RepID=A0A1B1AD35_9PROT|nr:hypothetical protein [Candidatus Viadribacter manganicus]ANP44462.1 hypothetical protein ATE48_00260 [Candidatus Viadribacter manganicus]